MMDREALCRAIATAQTVVDTQDPEWGMRFADELAKAGWMIVPLAQITEVKNALEALNNGIRPHG